MQKIGMLHQLMDAADFVEADRRVIGFRRRGEERAEADVIRAFRLRGDGLRDAVGRFADPAIFSPNDLARGRNREIVLAEVQPFERKIARDFGMVVDDQRDARVTR